MVDLEYYIVCEPFELNGLILLQREEDIIFEEELLRDCFSLKKWIQYLQSRTCVLEEAVHPDIASQMDAAKPRDLIFERALVVLPLSYKLWKMYLDERVERLFYFINFYRDHAEEHTARIRLLLASEVSAVNSIYERACVVFPRMPRLWLDYATFLMRQRRITLTRQTLDRALRALPLTLHERVWSLYLKFAASLETWLPDTTAEIWRRYWRVAADRGDPSTASRYLESLMRCGFYDAAASLLVELALNEPPKLAPMEAEPASPSPDSHEVLPSHYWHELCRVITQHGAAIKATPVEQVLRDAIEKAMRMSSFAALQQHQDDRGLIHSTGIFWNALATWHIKQGRLEEARQVYEEAIRSVPSVRDFSLVFDAYTKMEESVIAIKLEGRRRKKRKPDESSKDDKELDARMAHFEHLMEIRPFLLSDVRLRQQPHNVSVWAERLALIKEKKDKDEVVQGYERALSTVSGRRAKGSLAQLWCDYAEYVEVTLKDAEGARKIFQRAVESDFATVDDLATVWIAWSNLELRCATINDALDVIGQALTPSAQHKKQSDSPRALLFKNSRLWNHYLDLEEARGHVDAVCSAYDRVIDLKVATAQTFVNYAAFLESHGLMEEAFKVFDRGVAAFGYPIAFELWNLYLPKYVSFYAPKGALERIRDLFEQALRGCPPDLCRAIYIQYAQVEEKFGSARNALRIIQRAAHCVAGEHRVDLFELLLAKTRATLGVPAQRPVFEDAIDTLTGQDDLIVMSIRYAALEMSLGEYERTRAIYAHAASTCDPRIYPGLWSAWQEFETRHGTEGTFRDMLRVKRAVSAKYSATMSFVPASSAQEEEVVVAVEAVERAVPEE